MFVSHNHDYSDISKKTQANNMLPLHIAKPRESQKKKSQYSAGAIVRQSQHQQNQQNVQEKH